MHGDGDDGDQVVNDLRGLLLLLLLIDPVTFLHPSSFASDLFRRRRQYRDGAVNADDDDNNDDETVMFLASFSSMCDESLSPLDERGITLRVSET